MQQTSISVTKQSAVFSTRTIVSLTLALWLVSMLPLFAQMGLNAPAGLAPRQDMEIYSRNNFLIQSKFTITTADPAASVNTLSCAASPAVLSAQAGILKDPGGDSNYPASLSCSQSIFRAGGGVSGFEIVFEDLDTEADNDLVIITDQLGNTITFSGTTLPAPFFIVNGSFTVSFQANNNATVGRGFRLRWREVYNSASPTTVTTGFGRAFQFNVTRGALMSGYLTANAANRPGFYSTALGYSNTAIGDYSSAVGLQNTASATGASALGAYNRPSGIYSTALGYFNSTSGPYSSALGVRTSTGGFQGAMILSDFIPSDVNTVAVINGTANTAQNQLTARFSGGYRFISAYNNVTGAVTAGVVLAPGDNSWAAISDSTKKEHFLPVNYPEILDKLGSLRLGSWNYKGQPGKRHYGPMAQDFFARFGHDGIGTIGCDTLLAGHDFTAITLAGVQALIKENEQLKAENENRRAEVAQLRAEATRTDARLEAIEALLPIRKRVTNSARK